MVPFESFSIHILVTMAVSLAISEIFIVKQWPDLEIYGSGGNLNFRVTSAYLILVSLFVIVLLFRYRNGITTEQGEDWHYWKVRYRFINCQYGNKMYGYVRHYFNPLISTLKPQSNGPLYSNTVIGTLVVDGWDVECFIWYSQEGPRLLLTVPCNSPSINGQCRPLPTSYYSMRHYNYLCTVKG